MIVDGSMYVGSKLRISKLDLVTLYYLEDISAYKIAREFGVDVSSIYYAMEAFGLPRKDHPSAMRKGESRSLVLSMLAVTPRLTYREISSQLKITRQRVGQIALSAGHRRRTRKPRGNIDRHGIWPAGYDA